MPVQNVAPLNGPMGCNAIGDLGLGALGNSNLILKRKFRWTLEIVPQCGKAIPANFVKLAARPQLDIEETEINFLHSKTWIPGKAAWQAITVTYYDVAGTGGKDLQYLWNWIFSVYNFADGFGGKAKYSMGTSLNDYGADAYLTMFDGCGSPLENWHLKYAWPQSIQFGDLDYSNSEEATIELTIRYSDVVYKACCPPFTPNVCCTPCS